MLLVRPDGHLVTAFSGVRPAELYAAAEAALRRAAGRHGARRAGTARVAHAASVTGRPHSDVD